MSEKILKTVVCPKCAEKSETEIICSLNGKDVPDMKKSVLTDKFFQWKCPRCKFETQLLHPLLYNDMEKGFMVYYIPNTKRDILVDEKIESEFSDLSDIKKRLVSNVSELKEKIALLDENADDMAMELAKHAVERIVEKTANKTVYEGYFLEMSEEENTVSFQFFVGAERRPYIQTTRLEVYRRSLEIVRRYFSDINSSGFVKIDREWSKEAFKIYKSKQ